MVSPINSLMNMEYMLYGGASGVNPNCPSFSNGYMANNTAWNYQTPFGYNNQSIWNNQNLWNNQLAQQPAQAGAVDTFAPQAQQTQQQTTFGASQQDLDTLGKYYLKGLNPSESLLGAAGGGAAFALVNNMRFIAHPFASLSSLGATEKMFAGVKDKKSALGKLWNNPETNGLVRDAYHKMHKLEGASKWRFAPLFKKRLDETTYKALKNKMEMALLSGDKRQIAEATERIRVATGVQSGPVGNFFNKIWSKIRGQKVTTIADRLANNTAIREAALKKVNEKGAVGLTETITKGFKSQGVKGGAFFAAMEFIMDWSKIRSAFSAKENPTKTGLTQLGQTTVKAAGSLIGWTAGEAIGAWAGAKLGAAAGTVICPGLGTAIGAVAGLVGGSIGSWALGKLTHKIVGEDVGSKVEVQNMKKTAQGQQQLLQLTLAQAQEDKKNNKLDPKVAQALNNVYQAYA